jgi:probable HAF family extracellular repeat protein
LTAAITTTLMGTALALTPPVLANATPAHDTGIQYHAVPLAVPAFGGGLISFNNLDQVVGYINTDAEDTGFHPALWSHGTVTDIGTSLGTLWGGAYAINDRGWVIGAAENPYGGAFLWRDGTLTDLGLISGTSGYTTARAINDRGQILVQETLDDGTARDFVWQNGHMTDFGSSYLASINNSGEMTGARIVGTTFVPSIWRNGVQSDVRLPYPNAALGKINDHGDFIGNYGTDLDPYEGAFFVHYGRVTDLGTLGGFTTAYGLNDRGQVIGVSAVADGSTHVFLWQNGHMTDLSTRGIGPGLTPGGINNSGAVLVGNTLYAPDHN